ncbi:MAG: S1 RNA-binding domain-containing protein [Patescibacteria group bacterium]|nr:S1 RNA-binding domain-containing protein [Patescibacteria group bacterium]
MHSVNNKNFVQQFFKQFIKNKPDLFSMLKLGDLVQGSILEKGSNMMVVDLGRHGTGVVYRREMQNARDIVRGLKVGDPVHGKVIEIDNEEGVTELSLTEAGRQKAWTEVQELHESDEVLKVTPKSFNKGGLIANLNGLQAFLPVSQLSSEHYPRVSAEDRSQITLTLQKLVGEELTVKIIDINPRTNKLIVSEKAAAEISSKELTKNYEVGQVIEGIVSGVADFGVFIKFTDNPEVEGLIHVSELDHRIVNNPKEIVNVDDAVKAKITEIKDGKISLSLKALEPDPWKDSAEKYREGQTVTGKVYALHSFGAIINLDNQLQGQIHVSEFGGVPEMKKELSLGEEYSFTIEGVKPEEKRIILKLRKDQESETSGGK